MPGDHIHYGGTTVRILHNIKHDTHKHKDQFGQDMLAYWATRDDTGAEGWIVFGADMTIEMERVE